MDTGTVKKYAGRL